MRRVRRRYLALKANSDQPVNKEDIVKAIWNMIYQLFGEFGACQAALSFISFDQEKQIIILRCSHKMLDMVKATAAAVTKIGAKPAFLQVITVSGTLKALRKNLSEYA